jgi:hypothetical protein
MVTVVLPVVPYNQSTTGTTVRDESSQLPHQKFISFDPDTDNDAIITGSMVVILTEEEILEKGLQLVGFSYQRYRQKVSELTNLERFKATAGNLHVTRRNDPTFIIRVDGVHCSIFEPQDPDLPQNPDYYSHKHKKACLDYELGLSLFEIDLFA